MILCLNPACQQAQNPDGTEYCRSCGSKLTPLLRGRYRVMQPLGQGGFGKTYLAIDEDRLKTRCVIKQFSPQIQGTRAMEKAVQLFEQEAMRLHELGEHPHIPALLAYFEQDQRLYLVQQFIEGPTLAQEVHQQGPFGEQKIREVLVGLLPILKFVHDHQVIHRDITPFNIIRRKQDNRLVLIDFGVSKLLTTVTSSQPGTKIGTEGYAPIEQLRSGKAYPASDLYSLGATCVYLMTQMKPEELYDNLAGCWRWREHLAKRGTGINEPIARILDRLLKDLVSERYQSADEVMKDLRLALSTPSSQQRPGAVATPAGRPVSRPPSGPRMSAPPTQPSSPPTPGRSAPGQKGPTSRPPTSGQPQSRNCVHVLSGHSSWVTSLAFSPDGQLLASGSLDDSIRLWKVAEGEIARVLTGHTKAVNCVAISPDGHLLVSGSDDRSLRLWQVQTGQVLRVLPGHARDVIAVAISPDGQLLASGSEDRTVRLWKLANGEQIRAFSGMAGIVRSIAISADNQTLASGGLDNQIKLWNISTGAINRTLSGHFNSVMTVAMTPDGQTIASGSKDKTIRLWNLRTGEPIRTLTGHSDVVNSIAISPDGKTLISGSSDQTIKLWNWATGDLIGTLLGHTNPVTAVAISPNGKWFASGSSDNTVRIWQIA